MNILVGSMYGWIHIQPKKIWYWLKWLSVLPHRDQVWCLRLLLRLRFAWNKRKQARNQWSNKVYTIYFLYPSIDSSIEKEIKKDKKKRTSIVGDQIWNAFCRRSQNVLFENKNFFFFFLFLFIKRFAPVHITAIIPTLHVLHK